MRSPSPSFQQSRRSAGTWRGPRDFIRTGPVDARMDTALCTIRPTLAVEEPRGPCKIVALQPRELDRTRVRACPLNVRRRRQNMRALSHECARLVIARRADVRG